jgi:hypothetical protein
MMRQGAAVAAMLLAASGGAPAAPPTPLQLSTQNPGANVTPIVDFFRRTCIENIGDPASFQASLATSGWHAVQTQAQGRAATGGMMPSVWRLDHGQLLLTNLPPFGDCILSLQAMVAPRLSTLRAALRTAVARPGFAVLQEDPTQSVWAWPARPGMRWVLTIGLIPASPDQPSRPGQQGVSIYLAIDPIPAAGTDRE